MRWEEEYGKATDATLSGRFRGVVERARKATGQRVAILVDEYDKPLLSTLDKPAVHEEMKSILNAFYGVLKSVDEHLKFVLLTGVTKFGQVSVFSDLNQLTDLSLHPAYSSVCGITEAELVRDFQPELADLAHQQKLSEEGCLDRVRQWYNGYKFHQNGPSVFNPFSTLNLLSRKEFVDYWFQTGTPTFLVELLKTASTDLREIDGIQVEAGEFADYRQEPDRPIPVIYQSGYLTIQDYDPELRCYTLGYPNSEVKIGFLRFLASDYTGVEKGRATFHIGHFSRELRAGDVEAFLVRLKSFFAGIPYDLNDQTERHYQVVFYLVFTLLGQFIESEVKSTVGRADAVVKTPDSIFVFEFKLNGSAEEAIAQIDEKGYLVPYEADGRRLVKVGVEFDKSSRNLGRWIASGR